MHFPKPFFRKSRRLWYVQIDGRQHNLGTDKHKAFESYHELMRQPAATKIDPRLVVALFDEFLEWVQTNRAPETYE